MGYDTGLTSHLALFLNFFCLLDRCFFRSSKDGNLNTSKNLLFPLKVKKRNLIRIQIQKMQVIVSQL